jgi:hypothetical protein
MREKILSLLRTFRDKVSVLSSRDFMNVEEWTDRFIATSVTNYYFTRGGRGGRLRAGEIHKILGRIVKFLLNLEQGISRS